MTGYRAQVEPLMRLALDLARGTGPDVPVGAVVLDRAGQVAGQGRNRREADGDPTAHAEIIALRAAATSTRRNGEDSRDGCRSGSSAAGRQVVILFRTSASAVCQATRSIRLGAR